MQKIFSKLEQSCDNQLHVNKWLAENSGRYSQCDSYVGVQSSWLAGMADGGGNSIPGTYSVCIGLFVYFWFRINRIYGIKIS